MGNKIHENILVISGQELSLQRYKKFGIELHFKFVLLSWRLWSIEIKKKKMLKIHIRGNVLSLTLAVHVKRQIRLSIAFSNCLVKQIRHFTI